MNCGGLCLYEENNYITCSDDGTMRMWDIRNHEQIEVFDLKFDGKLKPLEFKVKPKFLPDSVKGRCLAVSPENFIVIGCKDGTVRIFDDKFQPKLCTQLSKK